MPSLYFDYAGIRCFVPEKLAGLPIEEVGWSVRLTERMEAAGAVKLADLPWVDLEAIVPPLPETNLFQRGSLLSA